MLYDFLIFNVLINYDYSFQHPVVSITTAVLFPTSLLSPIQVFLT